MELPVHILAVLGFVAVLRRFLKAALALATRAADAVYAHEMQATRARRGDVTGMEEAREWAVCACKGRREAIAAVVFWLALLLLPLSLASSPAPAYAAYAMLSLLDGARRHLPTARPS